MKNIHVLPTDKPSRLSILNSGKLNFGAEIMSSYNSKPQHIYITNSDEIKIGDWCINLNSPYQHKELCRIDNQIELERYAQKTVNACRKIILTTDQELIKDGVQSVDDEFLEWFVKNPSCEEVEVRKIGKEWTYNAEIPKEEPKKDEDDKFFIDSVFNKQETLEEFINSQPYYGSCTHEYKEGIELGAKWQQERMYSEEEVIGLLNDFRLYSYNHGCGLPEFKEWFNLNKKL